MSYHPQSTPRATVLRGSRRRRSRPSVVSLQCESRLTGKCRYQSGIPQVTCVRRVRVFDVPVALNDSSLSDTSDTCVDLNRLFATVVLTPEVQ